MAYTEVALSPPRSGDRGICLTQHLSPSARICRGSTLVDYARFVEAQHRRARVRAALVALGAAAAADTKRLDAAAAAAERTARRRRRAAAAPSDA
jgi:hypothetical protein